MITRSLVALALSASMIGCGASAKGLESKVQRGQVTADQASVHQALVAEGDAAWELRGDRAQLELAIQKWDQAVKSKDDDWETYAKLARATYLLADGWLFFEKDQPAGQAAYLSMHERGYTYAERGMAAQSPDYEKRRMAGTKIDDAVKVVGRNGVALVYWYATNLGKWAKEKGFTTVLENKDRIFKLVSRVYEIGPDYFYGAADRYFGAFYAVAPKFAGGDVQKSYEHFQASLKAAPNYLGTYNLIAELYAPLEDSAAGKAADENAFKANLQIIINAQPCPEGGASMQPCIMKGLEPESAVEKRKAEDLLKRRDEFF
jgi:hypothetical protein